MEGVLASVAITVLIAAALLSACICVKDVINENQKDRRVAGLMTGLVMVTVFTSLALNIHLLVTR